MPGDTVDRTRTPPPITALRSAAPIVVDGHLNEAVWQGAAMVTQFIQSSPDEGRPATEATEVRIAVDDEALYIAARLSDRAADSVLALLTRRDRESQSDFFTVLVDPYHDRRTGYEFTVSAAGQQSDGTLYNDGFNDSAWDGVWQSAVTRDATGWSVELRIPFSQLRLKDREDQVWGVNVGRGIGRKGEVSYLVPRLRGEAGFVSRFAELHGLEGIQPRRRFEVVPYVTARSTFESPTPGDPFRDGSTMATSVGGDLRAGLGGSLQLAATVNPDFGQVEVDPAVVNLSDVETFFEERRPFFVEGSSIFNFGFGGANNFMGFNWVNNETFYSRRIGRSPQGRVPDAEFTDVPQGSRILGAAKLTGLVSGWNVGVLGGATERTFARTANAGVSSAHEVEPFTGYGVVRAQRDIAGGRHGIGMIGTWTGRAFQDASLRDQLNASGMLLGLDGWITLDRDREWVLSGWGSLTRVTGTAARIAALQTGPVHYFQRPDAEHLAVDSTRTSLSGGFARLSLNRQSGATLFNAAVGAVTPGFENNDLGFIGQTDLINAHIAPGYQWTTPGSWYNRAQVQAAIFGRWDFGGNQTGTGIWSNSSVTFKNFNFARFGVFAQPSSVSNRATRGGPLVHSPAGAEFSGEWESDGRKALTVGLEATRSIEAEGAGNGWSVSASLNWRPASNVTLSIGPEYGSRRNATQYLRTVVDPLASGTYGHRYVFGELDQRTLAANIRANWIFTPALSLELFAQPLVSSGQYHRIRELQTPGGFDFLDYGTDGSTLDRGTGMVDPDGSGPAAAFSIGQPDFTFASLRGNAILRWEYAPGSALFLVWTQDRAIQDGMGEFRPRRSFGDLLDAPGRNVLLVKASYWFGR